MYPAVFVFVKPSLIGEVGSEAARRGDPSVRGNKSEHSVTVPFFRGDSVPNVINLKRLLNGKQNVWKYQNGEEKSDSDGREKDV